jgi:hypothetical protein
MEEKMRRKGARVVAAILMVTCSLVTDAMAQDLFVMSVKGKATLQRKGREAEQLERGGMLPAGASVEIGDQGVLQILGPGGKTARIEGPCLKSVSSIADALYRSQIRDLSELVVRLWRKFADRWRDEGDLDSSGGTRGETGSVRAADARKNPPGSEIVLISPRGGKVLDDKIVFNWVNGGAVTPQKLTVWNDRLEVVYETEVLRTRAAMPESKLTRKGNSVFFWSVTTPGCNPDQSFFRLADPSVVKEIETQIEQANVLAGSDAVGARLLRATVYEDAECFADACREYLSAAVDEPSETTRGLLEGFVVERLGLTRKAANEALSAEARRRGSR